MEEQFSFGYWLRRQRLARDLRQAELARRLGIAPITLRKIEADERRPSLQLIGRLADLLALSADEREQLIRVARADLTPAALPLPATPRAAHPFGIAPSPAPPAPGTRSNNLPAQPTPLIGRAAELAALCATLARPDVHLVTLTGPGGTGKTRLALRAAADLSEFFPQGIWLVDLAPIAEPALVLPTIARALGIREHGGQALASTLCDALRDQQALLLLDNFEQVLDAAPELAGLLAAAPRLKLLVTSRAPLHLAAEHVVAVPPLVLPPSEARLPAEQLGRYSAVQLFVERARAARSDFALTDASAPVVAAICERLDGLPLAIELAAAHARLFPPEALLARMDQRLQLLTGGPRDSPARQQTLRNTIAWSYALLSQAEQALFRRLGVFVGGWTLEMAEAVWGAGIWNAGDARGAPSPDFPTPALDGLSALLDQSLVRQSAGADGEPRFGMLETIRAFALEQLEPGKAADARARHAAALLALAERAAPNLRGARMAVWLQLLDADHGNLRAALAYLAERGSWTQLARMCAALWWYWWQRGYWREGQQWLSQTLAAGELLLDDLTRARLRCALGWMHTRLSEFAIAQPLLAASLDQFLADGDAQGQGFALAGLGLVAQGESADRLLIERMHAALDCFGRAGDQAGMAFALGYIADARFLQGDFVAVESAARQGQAVARAAGDSADEATALVVLAQVAVVRGQYVRAAGLLEESLAIERALGNRQEISSCLNWLGEVALHQGEYPRAAALWSESLELRRALGNRRGVTALQTNLARVAIRQGDLVRARGWLAQLAELARELDYGRGCMWALFSAAQLAAAARRPEQAVRLASAADALAARYDLSIEPELRAEYDQAVADARAALDEEAFAAAWAAGRSLALDAALGEALAV